MRARTFEDVDHLRFQVTSGSRGTLFWTALVGGVVSLFGLFCMAVVVTAVLGVLADLYLPVGPLCPILAAPLFLVVSLMIRRAPLQVTEVSVRAQRVDIGHQRVAYEAIARCRRRGEVLVIEAERVHEVPDPDSRVYDALVKAIDDFDANQAASPESDAERAQLANLRRGSEGA